MRALHLVHRPMIFQISIFFNCVVLLENDSFYWILLPGVEVEFEEILIGRHIQQLRENFQSKIRPSKNRCVYQRHFVTRQNFDIQ